MRTVGGSFTSFPPMFSNEHISKEQSAYSRTEHKCAKVGGDRHDGCTVVDDGSLKITQMYLLTMCLNMLNCAQMCTDMKAQAQKLERVVRAGAH